MTKPKAKAQAGFPVPAIGIVCWRGDEVLMIRRGRAPRQGQWSIPGGKVHLGEGLHAAGLRELYEETGVRARITRLIEVYEIIEPGFHYVLVDYAAEWLSGNPTPADDAAEARFMTMAQALSLVEQDDIRDVLCKSREPAR